MTSCLWLVGFRVDIDGDFYGHRRLFLWGLAFVVFPLKVDSAHP